MSDSGAYARFFGSVLDAVVSRRLASATCGLLQLNRGGRYLIAAPPPSGRGPSGSEVGKFGLAGFHRLGLYPGFAHFYRPLRFALSSSADVYAAREILRGRRMSAVRLVTPRTDRIDSRAVRRRSGRGHGTVPKGFALSLLEPTIHQGNCGRRMRPQDENWVVVHRSSDRARRRLLRPELFRANSMAEPRPSEAGPPVDEPSGNEDPSILPPRRGSLWRIYRGPLSR